MFSLAPAVPKAEESIMISQEHDGYMAYKSPVEYDAQGNSVSYYPKSILKQSPLHDSLKNPEKFPAEKKVSRSKLKVSINLPDNEISLANSKLLGFVEDESGGSSNIVASRNYRSNVVMRSPVCLPANMTQFISEEGWKSSRSIMEVLKEVDSDILALQDVKADEEKGMSPLSDLATSLGMKYVFAESWAPGYGNAILSKWPIKRWKVQKIANDEDFRNVLKATIHVPWAGEVDFYCTQLDHLDENWRMKQIGAMIKSNDMTPHILAGGINSLDGSDYSSERWMDIVKYYEDIGKPTPRIEVTNFLKGKGYVDAKDYAGECEPVVIVAKGQNVQGTCKYGTRVDYMLASPYSPYKFVPGSYSVISSKGTSDHHIVKADIIKAREGYQGTAIGEPQQAKQKVVRITNPWCSRGLWKLNT